MDDFLKNLRGAVDAIISNRRKNIPLSGGIFS